MLAVKRGGFEEEEEDVDVVGGLDCDAVTVVAVDLTCVVACVAFVVVETAVLDVALVRILENMCEIGLFDILAARFCVLLELELARDVVDVDLGGSATMVGVAGVDVKGGTVSCSSSSELSSELSSLLPSLPLLS